MPLKAFKRLLIGTFLFWSWDKADSSYRTEQFADSEHIPLSEQLRWNFRLSILKGKLIFFFR